MGQDITKNMSNFNTNDLFIDGYGNLKYQGIGNSTILANGDGTPIIPPSEVFSESIVLDQLTIQTVPASSGILSLHLKIGATQIEGVTKFIYIPAGNAIGINNNSLLGLNISGDPFNSTHNMVVIVGKMMGHIVGTIRDLGIADITSPIILSAKIDQINTPSILDITFSKPVYITDMTGLSLLFFSGIPKTLFSFAGNGTTKISFTLSDLVLSDKLSLIVSSCNIQDVNANILADVVFAVHLDSNFSDLPGCVLQWNAVTTSEVTLSNSDVLTIIDRSPFVNTISSISNGNHKPTWIDDTGDGTGAIQFSSIANSEQYLTITKTPIDPTLDFTICMLVNFQSATDGTYNGFWSIDDIAGNGISFYQRSDINQGLLTIASGHPNIIFADFPTFTNDNWHFIILYRHGNKFGARFDLNTIVESDWDGIYPNIVVNLASMTIGSWIRGSIPLLSSNSKLKAIGAWNRYLGLTEQQAIRDFTHTHFTDCP